MQSIISYHHKPEFLLIALLKRFWFLFNDKTYLKLRYYFEMHEKLNLKNPQKFTEKIQWLKLFNRKAEYTVMVDKLAVKNYIADIIGKEYVIPTIGIWSKVEEIDFCTLPNEFVLKNNHSGGSTGVVICKDKNKFDISHTKKLLNSSLKSNIYYTTKEWPYKNIEPKIFAETLLYSENGKDLTDYKFYCFNGTPTYCQVISNRKTNETIDFYDINWVHQPFYGLNPKCKQSVVSIEKPQNYDLMINIARILSRNIPFVRIDLYNINGRVYFGEITFFPASGFGVFTPIEWDLILGQKIKLPYIEKESYL